MMESKNDDPHGCPDRVLGECEAVCACCQRDMHPEVERLRDELRQADEFGRGEFRVTQDAYDRVVKALERRDEAAAAVEQWSTMNEADRIFVRSYAPPLAAALDEQHRVHREGEQ